MVQRLCMIVVLGAHICPGFQQSLNSHRRRLGIGVSSCAVHGAQALNVTCADIAAKDPHRRNNCEYDVAAAPECHVVQRLRAALVLCQHAHPACGERLHRPRCCNTAAVERHKVGSLPAAAVSRSHVHPGRHQRPHHCLHYIGVFADCGPHEGSCAVIVASVSVSPCS